MDDELLREFFLSHKWAMAQYLHFLCERGVLDREEVLSELGGAPDLSAFEEVAGPAWSEWSEDSITGGGEL